MADPKKKPLMQSFIEMKKAKKDEKDENAKIGVLDALDPQSLVLKQNLIGPSFEDMSRSKLYNLVANEERPTSHIAKTAIAAAADPIIDLATGEATKALKLKKIKKATSKVADNIADDVEGATKNAMSSKVFKKAERAGDDFTKKAISDYNSELKKLEGIEDNLKKEHYAAENIKGKKSLGIDLNEQDKHIMDSYNSLMETMYASRDKQLGEVNKYKQLIYDYLNGMPIDDINKKYGEAYYSVEWTQPWGKKKKSAVKKYKLDPYQASVIHSLEEHPQIKGLLEESIAKDSDDMLDWTATYLIDGKNAGKTPEELQKGMNKAYSETIKPAVDIKNKGLKDTSKKAEEDLIKDTKSSLEEISKYGGKVDDIVKGGKILSNDDAKKRVIGKIIKNARKEDKYYKVFDKLIDSKDPIYKALEKVNYQNIVDNYTGLESLIADGMTVPELVQTIALERTLDHYDNAYISALESVVDPKNTSSIKAIDLPNSPFRKKDGTLKDLDKIVEALAEDPLYRHNINDVVQFLTGNKELYATTKGAEAAAVPILGQWTKRAIETGKMNKDDIFSKDTAKNLRPWDPDLEFSTSRKLADNALNFVNYNFDLDPSRYTKSDLAALRNSLIYANNKAGKWNPTQIKRLSDREILNFARAIGNGNYSDLPEFTKEVLLKLEELAPRLEEKHK